MTRTHFTARALTALRYLRQRPFRCDEALEINARRLEHLVALEASRQIALAGKSVLEVGAGIGLLSTFFLARGCDMHITDGRASNVARLRELFASGLPGVRRVEPHHIYKLDLDHVQRLDGSFQIVFCYGVLYHCCYSATILELLASVTTETLLLETMISNSEAAAQAVNHVRENRSSPDQSLYGVGSRPGLELILSRLRPRFASVTVARRGPLHPDYQGERPARVVIIARK